MKITTERLKQIIKEEQTKFLIEQEIKTILNKNLSEGARREKMKKLAMKWGVPITMVLGIAAAMAGGQTISTHQDEHHAEKYEEYMAMAAEYGRKARDPNLTDHQRAEAEKLEIAAQRAAGPHFRSTAPAQDDKEPYDWSKLSMEK